MDIGIDKIVATVVSSDGNLGLAAERLNRSGNIQEKVTEYELKVAIVSDPQTVKTIAEKLRGLLILKVFDDLMATQAAMLSGIDDMKPADVGRLHASMLGVFTQLTAPAVKDTFDFEGEVIKTAAELGVPIDEVRADLKKIMANKSEARAMS